MPTKKTIKIQAPAHPRPTDGMNKIQLLEIPVTPKYRELVHKFYDRVDQMIQLHNKRQTQEGQKETKRAEKLKNLQAKIEKLKKQAGVI